MTSAQSDEKSLYSNGKLYYVWEQTPDSTYRIGRHPAVISSVEDANGHQVTLWKPGRPAKLPKQGLAEILVEGPIYDITTAGTDFIVSEIVKEFLFERVSEHCNFLPVDLQDKKGKKAGKRYHAIQFTRSVAAVLKFMEYDLEQISTCGYPLFVAYNKKDSCMTSFFIEAELAEEMIAADFSGLGFSNPFDGRKPGLISPEKLTQLENLSKTAPEQRLDRFKEIALVARTPTDGWADILLLLGKERRSKKWQELTEASVNEDVKAAGDWLSAIFTEAPPGDKVLAFWFGLYEAWEDGGIVPKIHVRGSGTYMEDTPYNHEWTADSIWIGSDGTFDSRVMRQLGEFADKHEAISDTVLYTAVLGYAALLVRFALEQVAARFGALIEKPIAVGFESGDFLFLREPSYARIGKVPNFCSRINLHL